MLQAIGLTKTYGEQTALDNLDLSIAEGEIFCLLGQNGAGKTTTINLFLGFANATSGRALINDLEVRANDVLTKKLVAYIPETVMLYGNLSALENLDFFSRLAGFRYDKQLLQQYLDEVGLQKEAHGKRVGVFSKGMRQKVGIAIALAKDAKAIFMDEPTSGLDPKATQEFTRITRRLGEKGKTILMATHDIFNAVNVGNNIGIMNKGRLVHSIKATEINATGLQQLYLETI